MNTLPPHPKHGAGSIAGLVPLLAATLAGLPLSAAADAPAAVLITQAIPAPVVTAPTQVVPEPPLLAAPGKATGTIAPAQPSLPNGAASTPPSAPPPPTASAVVPAAQPASPASPPVVAISPSQAAPLPAPPATSVESGKSVSTANPELATLKTRVEQLEATVRSQGLLDLLGQVQALRAELAKLRGSLEEMRHAQQIADKRGRELFSDLDDRHNKLKTTQEELERRLRELASAPPATPTVPPPTVEASATASATPPGEAQTDKVRLQSSRDLAASASPADAEAENKAYDAALNHFKIGDYGKAVSAFQAFLKLYPRGAFASNAHYWLGLSYFSQGDYKGAAAAQLRLLKDFPQSHKAPDAMVSLARAQIQLGELDLARHTLEQIQAKYPLTKAADSARKMLAILK